MGRVWSRPGEGGLGACRSSKCRGSPCAHPPHVPVAPALPGHSRLRARGSSLELPVPPLAQPCPGGGCPRQPFTGTNGVISLRDVAKCFQSSQTMRRTRPASPFPASPRGHSQPGASAASGLQCPGQLTPLGRPGVGGCGEEGRDRSTEPSRGSQQLRASDGLCFCCCSQLGTRQAAESGRRARPAVRLHGWCSGGWLEAPSRYVLLFQGLFTRFTRLSALLLCGVSAAGASRGALQL